MFKGTRVFVYKAQGSEALRSTVLDALKKEYDLGAAFLAQPAEFQIALRQAYVADFKNVDGRAVVQFSAAGMLYAFIKKDDKYFKFGYFTTAYESRVKIRSNLEVTLQKAAKMIVGSAYENYHPVHDLVRLDKGASATIIQMAGTFGFETPESSLFSEPVSADVERPPRRSFDQSG